MVREALDSTAAIGFWSSGGGCGDGGGTGATTAVGATRGWVPPLSPILPAHHLNGPAAVEATAATADSAPLAQKKVTCRVVAEVNGKRVKMTMHLPNNAAASIVNAAAAATPTTRGDSGGSDGGDGDSSRSSSPLQLHMQDYGCVCV